MSSDLQRLASEAWRLYDRLRDERFVYRPSFPILYFGDMPAYRNSKPRIVTLALNPSWREFETDRNGFKRFPAIRVNVKPGIETYLAALDEYFKTRPYMTWFRWYDDVLKGFGAGYAKGVVHIDLFSPLGTKPGWSSLTKNQKLRLEKSGVPLCQKLIRSLKPEVILASMGKNYLSRLINGTNLPPRSGQLARWTKLSKVLIVHGAASRRPFGKLDPSERKRVGRAIRPKYSELRGDDGFSWGWL